MRRPWAATKRGWIIRVRRDEIRGHDIRILRLAFEKGGYNA
jgi:hypothetical protein